MTKRERRCLSDDGLPVDARAWTAEMWSILHRHTEAAKREMREAYERHLRAQEGTQGTPLHGGESPHDSRG